MILLKSGSTNYEKTLVLSNKKNHAVVPVNQHTTAIAEKMICLLSLMLSCFLVLADPGLTRDGRNLLKNSRPLVSFIDDDGSNNVLTELKPLFTSRHIPVGLAIVGNAEIVADEAKRSEVLELQNEEGWEILSHSMSHQNYRALSSNETETDFQDYIGSFTSYGFEIHELVFPYGFSAKRTRAIASRYFYAAYNNFAGISDTHNNRYSINRIPLGTYMGIGRQSLADFKSIIDSAKSANNWLVFMMHFGESGNDITLIENVLDYIISSDIAIVTLFEGAIEMNSV